MRNTYLLMAMGLAVCSMCLLYCYEQHEFLIKLAAINKAEMRANANAKPLHRLSARDKATACGWYIIEGGPHAG
jgi:hypothetical protein